MLALILFQVQVLDLVRFKLFLHGVVEHELLGHIPLRLILQFDLVKPDGNRLGALDHSSELTSFGVFELDELGQWQALFAIVMIGHDIIEVALIFIFIVRLFWLSLCHCLKQSICVSTLIRSILKVSILFFLGLLGGVRLVLSSELCKTHIL